MNLSGLRIYMIGLLRSVQGQVKLKSLLLLLETGFINYFGEFLKVGDDVTSTLSSVGWWRIVDITNVVQLNYRGIEESPFVDVTRAKEILRLKR